MIPTRGETPALSTKTGALRFGGSGYDPFQLFSAISDPPFFFLLHTLLNYWIEDFSFSLRNLSTNILVTTSKIDNHCYRKVLAICEEKPFLRRRQTWLILKKTVVMRRSISRSSCCLLVPSPLFVSEQVACKVKNREILKLNGASWLFFLRVRCVP